MKKKIKLFCILFVLLLLTSCSKPLPNDKKDYAGVWESSNVYLEITEGGSVSYRRVEGKATTTINAPIKEFSGNNFIVGISFFTTTFEVSKPPAMIDGEWKMTVDGVELVRH